MNWNVVQCLVLCLFQLTCGQEPAIKLRSKGDPPKILQHRIQQKLLQTIDAEEFRPSSNNLVQYLKDTVNDEEAWKPTPFRESPYIIQSLPANSHEHEEEDTKQEDTGLSLAVDDRTFDVIGGAVNGNMGNFVKTAAKDFRGFVDGAAKFVHNSVKKTLAPKRKPAVLKDSGNSLLNLFGLLPPKNEEEPSSGYGIPDAPVLTSDYGVPEAPIISAGYGVPQAEISTAYGVPNAPPISNGYGPPPSPPVSTTSPSVNYGPPPPITDGSATTASPRPNNNYNTNFQDLRLEDAVGPSVEALQANFHSTTTPTTTSTLQRNPQVNPFLSLTTTTTQRPINNNAFVDPIYRPKRNKNQRPGSPPPNFFQSSTSPPHPTPTAVIINQQQQKDKELEEVKLAWYNYYKKATRYVHKYKETIDVQKFKQSLHRTPARPQSKQHFVTTLRPSPTTPGPHPIPFQGQVHLQLPFKGHQNKSKRNKPLFTLSARHPPRPPSPRPTRRKPPSLNFIENNHHRSFANDEASMDALHDTLDYTVTGIGDILTPDEEFPDILLSGMEP